MDPSTEQQQSIPDNELALNNNSVGQEINIDNGHGDSEEGIPFADDGASDDNAAVDDGVAQSLLSRKSDEDALAQDSWMDLGISQEQTSHLSHGGLWRLASGPRESPPHSPLESQQGVRRQTPVSVGPR